MSHSLAPTTVQHTQKPKNERPLRRRERPLPSTPALRRWRRTPRRPVRCRSSLAGGDRRVRLHLRRGPQLAPLLLSSLALSFLLWNSLASSSDRSVSLFLVRFPDSDLRSARHGQLVKVAGVVSCGNVSLESSYEKVRRCVYMSTALYWCKGFEFWASIARHGWFGWRLAYLERLTADFYITDAKSGMRFLVKAGNDSKVIPLIVESPLVHNRRQNTVLSSTLRKWLGERNHSAEDNMLHLEEGYVEEGSPLTVLGILNKSDGILMITPPTECICTGCQWKKCLLPTDFHGLASGSPMAQLHWPALVLPCIQISIDFVRTSRSCLAYIINMTIFI